MATMNKRETEVSSFPESPQSESQTRPPPPYHVFPRAKKLQMVCMVSMAAIFSPLSSNIYFPALGDVARVSKTEHQPGITG